MSKNRTGALVAIVTLAIQASFFFGPRSLVIGAESTSFAPDPIAVQRDGPAWKYPQAGWLVVHIEGEPYERGYQHGRLLAREIVDYIKTLARTRSHKDPEAAWKALRLLSDTTFLRRYDQECLEEMKGIADGAAAAGAKFDKRRLDLLDIVTLNCDVEIGFLESALAATPTGIDSQRFGAPQASPPLARKREQCSAFVATRPATTDATGGVMMGHITMSDLSFVYHFNVWLDVTPSMGHRFVCQTFPGGIQSGMDYYISASGLLIAETTIDQTSFNISGETEASRIRRAVQYANSIDEAVKILGSRNNGLYTNEWLLADTKTNEIAMFELGTRHTKLYRSNRDEWPGGTKGFYWGCNNTKDRDVLSDTVADVRGKPGNLVLHPGRRDVAWLKLFDKHQQRGGLAEAFGFEAYSTPPIVGYPSCDAKFTTSTLAKDLSSWAIFGPPLGRAWRASIEELETDPEVQPLVANDWTLLKTHEQPFRRAGGVSPPVASSDDSTPPPQASTGGLTPPARQGEVAVDLDPFPEEEHETKLKFEQRHPFAWRGTLRPKTPADKGLAAAFAEFEKIVSFENALRADAKDGKLDRAARDLVDVALFTSQSNWWAARQRLGRDVPFSQTQPDSRSLDWYPIALGQGVMLLAELRQTLGADRFDKLLDDFGVTHADQEITTEQFRKVIWRGGSKEAAAILGKWLESDVVAKDHVGSCWSIHSFEPEPERALIVFGTGQKPGSLEKPGIGDAVANREIGERLQYAVARRFANHFIPLKADRDVNDEDLKSHHLLVVGEPLTNALLLRAAEKSPVRFGNQSFSVRGETFADHDSAVIVASENPWNSRYSVVAFAGLSARATHRIVDSLSPDEELSPQVVVFPAHRVPQRFVVR
jgi:phospholipase B-like protein